MLTRIFNFLFGNVPVRFPSEFPLSESVARLRARTKRSVFVSLFERSAAGPVTESRVRLQRVIPFFGNSFKPIFVGRFEHSHGRVILQGRFTMFLFSKIFMTAWLGFAVVLTIIAAAATLHTVMRSDANPEQDLMTLLFPLVGIGFFLAGVAFVRGCWWLSRSDIPFLTSVIQAALRDRASNSAMERTR